MSNLTTKTEEMPSELLSPPNSDTSSPLRAFSDSGSEPGSPNHCSTESATRSMHDQPLSFHGMRDRSRITVCMFMLTILVFNPFSWLTNFQMSYDQDHVLPGRTILSEESYCKS